MFLQVCKLGLVVLGGFFEAMALSSKRPGTFPCPGEVAAHAEVKEGGEEVEL